MDLAEGITKGRPQVRRERADKLIQQMIAEAEVINSDPTMMYRVAVLAVFGSYLTEKSVLGDLDIALGLKMLWTPETYDDCREILTAAYPMPKSVAADFMERLGWPETVVRRRLKVGRGISLHDFSELTVLGCPYQVVFGSDDAAQPSR